MARPLHLRNASVWDPRHDTAQTLRRDLAVAARVLATMPSNALTLDFDGLTVFPGLVNAHDHLELNHYPRTKFRERYDNAHQWGEDVNACLNASPFRELRAVPLDDRLFIGGLKNLLCGATTVAHHNPPHRALFQSNFPVRVVRRYGWAHSLHFSTDAEIRASFAATPPDMPWMIHLAEGTDATAYSEYAHLKALGGIGPNTVLIHGVGLDLEMLGSDRPALVWCPTSNHYLLGQTVTPDVLERATVALGSDSRLTADGDLLDELRAAHHTAFGAGNVDALLPLVTEQAAQILRLAEAGNLRTGAYGDFIALRTGDCATTALCHARRANLALVVKGGVPQIGDPEIMAQFADVPAVAATLDGRPKVIHRTLAVRLAKCTLQEAGLTVDTDAVKSRRRLFSRS